VIGVAGVGVGGASGSPEEGAAALAVEFFLLGRCNNISNVRKDASSGLSNLSRFLRILLALRISFVGGLRCWRGALGWRAWPSSINCRPSWNCLRWGHCIALMGSSDLGWLWCLVGLHHRRLTWGKSLRPLLPVRHSTSRLGLPDCFQLLLSWEGSCSHLARM